MDDGHKKDPYPLRVTAEALTGTKNTTEDVRKILAWTMWRLEEVNTWEREEIAATLRETAELVGWKLRDFLRPLFIAMTGKTITLPLFEVMEILGRDLCRARLRYAVNIIKPVSKKELKRWPKEIDKAIKDRAAAEAAQEPPEVS